MNPAEWTAAYKHPATLAEYLTKRDKFLRPPHVELLSQTVAAAVLGPGSGRFIVTMPPRHGKSTTCSAWLPFWFLNLFPEKHVMLVSYGAEFAQKWGRRVRRLANIHKDETMMRIAPDSRSAAEWETTEEGGMKSLGIGGDATGRGADLLIIDDPVKNSEEARSPVMRQKTWEFWQETLRTRIEPGGTVLVVQTRWNEDDLAGRLIAEDNERAERGEPKRWTCIDFPALAEGDDELGRTEGEPLWPGRFDLEMLAEIRIDVGSYAWSALYQQRPSPEGGGMFRKTDFRYWYQNPDHSMVLVHENGTEERLMPSDVWRAQITDTAMEIKTVNDWTVTLTYAVTKKRQVILLDVVRVRIEVPDQLPQIRRLKKQWRPRWSGVEVKGSGHGIIQEARRQGLMLRPIKAVKDKVTRASPAAALYEQHAVFHPRYAPWLAEYEHELQAFPNGAFDDQVDTIAHAVNELAPQAGYDGAVRRTERQTTGMADGAFEGAY
jgi:predicted phage terminase large subunit-like protein